MFDIYDPDPGFQDVHFLGQETKCYQSGLSWTIFNWTENGWD